jgi:hypothetical protein
LQQCSLHYIVVILRERMSDLIVFSPPPGLKVKSVHGGVSTISYSEFCFRSHSGHSQTRCPGNLIIELDVHAK